MGTRLVVSFDLLDLSQQYLRGEELAPLILEFKAAGQQLRFAC